MSRVQTNVKPRSKATTNGVHAKKITGVGSGKILKSTPESADSRIVELTNRPILTPEERRTLEQIVRGLSDRREGSLRASLLGLLKHFDNPEASQGMLEECGKLVGETLGLAALYGRGAIMPRAK